MKTRLARRTLLRGLGLGGALVGVPLPRLGAMLNGHGEAYADGSPLPRRFGVWFFGNGVIHQTWTPKGEGTGRDWQLNEAMADLAPFKTKLSVVTGHKNIGNVHWSPAGSLGGYYDSNHSFKAPSIDQLIASKIAAGTRRRSIELLVSDCVGEVGPTMHDGLSYSAPYTPNIPTKDPRVLFDQLFKQGGTAAASGQQVAAMARKKVVDSVREDATLLRKRLGTEDQRRIDQHLEGLLALEKDMVAMPASSCSGAAPPEGIPVGALDNGDDIREDILRAHHELVKMALACDVTRVFSIIFSRPAARLHLRKIGLGSILHPYYTHVEKDVNGFQPSVDKAVKYTMGCLADLLGRLDSVKEGASTLLDNTCVYTTSCVAWGKPHSMEDFPALLSGRAGGALKGDVHLRGVGNPPLNRVLFTLLQAYGAAGPHLGDGTHRVTDGLSALRA